ncbi:MAG: BatD family protein [Deltaproteobacteria bacterium]|nr:BatD family protein [Deltaproteobacteria bacterium]
MPRVPRVLGRLVLLALTWLVAPAALAARAVLTVDTDRVAVGQTVTLRLEVADGQAAGVPEVPAPEGARIRYVGQSQSAVIVNFQATRTVTYQYALTPLEPGILDIGPVAVPLRSGTVVAPAVSLEVAPSEPSGRGRKEGARAELVSTPEGSQADLWAGQVVVYRFVFHHRDPLVDARWSPPAFEGFTPEPSTEQVKREYRIEEAGQAVAVHEILVPLVATGEGRGTIPPATVEASFTDTSGDPRRRRPLDEFFDLGFTRTTRQAVLASDAVSWRIRALPEPDPEEGASGFSGLVGHFEVRSQLGAARVRAGESVTLTVEIAGDGTLSGFRLPPSPDSGAFRAYDDAPEVTGALEQGRFRSVARLRRAIVPLEEGLLQIPPIPITWFDPQEGRYVTASIPGGTLEVLPGEVGDPDVVSFAGDGRPAQHEVEALGEDILPIHTGVRIASRRLEPSDPVSLLLVGLPGLALLVQLAGSLKGRLGARSRRHRAIRALAKRLPSDRDARLAALDQALREAAGLALELPPASVDAARLEEALPPDLGPVAADLYRRLSGFRYGGGETDPDLDGQVLRMVDRLLGRAR